MKYNLAAFPLNYRNYRKLVSKVDFIAKYLINNIFYFSVFFTQLSYTIAILFDYLNPESNIYIINAICGYLLFLVFSMQTYSILWIGTTIWYSSTLYGKLKFIEIYDKIINIVNKYTDNRYTNVLLMNAIIEHNVYEKKVKEFNHLLRCATFIMYYLATPGYQIVFYVIHHKESEIFARIFASFGVIICFSAVIAMNVMSAWISKSAHKPYPLLYSFLARKQPKISLRFRLKIMSFIDYLSGPEIGIYCYDLFPMNNYEFYQYIYISGVNYILLMSLF